ncbi:MAG: putative Rossmann fold flavoprotein [Chlamydiales bacterium]|jgi:predicted Rossmann fold flavoprotein
MDVSDLCDQPRELLIVGAGAAGLWAAQCAARGGAEAWVLEKTPRTGSKILASGGSRCNLTTTLDPDGAARLFGARAERFLRHAFRTLPPNSVRESFAEWGVPTVEAPLEKIFPESQSAKDVRDALEKQVRASGARIVLEAPVVGVSRVDEGWAVELADGRRAIGRTLFLCVGGASYPKTGTIGEGYEWLEGLGLPLEPRVPALVPLSSPAAWVHELTGIAWASGEARLCDADGAVLGRRRRPLLFTHQGVSGPAAMDLSRYVTVARAAAPPGAAAESFTLFLDLYPDLSREALRDLLIAGAGAKGAPCLSRVLADSPSRRMLRALVIQAGLPGGDPRVVALGKAQRHALVETLKGLPIPIDGALGFDKAEVTAGGLDLARVNPRTMEVNAQPGLYVFGELLNLDGPIGGLNFQAAFACAELAARDVLARRP